MDAANTWTDERVELLKKLWSTGKSASQIASQIGGGVTRNAVIGKVHRLGLSGRGKAKAATPARPRRVASKPETTSEPVRFAAPRAPVVPVAVDPSEEAVTVATMASDIAIPPSERVALVDLREASCRWPVGDPMTPEFGFCGAQSVPSLPYCPHHCQIAYQPVADRRKERRAS